MIDEKRAKKYCSEDISKIENYEKAITDKTQTWDCHHKLEIQGQFRNSTKLLIKCGLYYNVPAWQLIFLTHKEHRRLHMLGKQYSTATKQKMSEAHRGNTNMLGKHLSAETRRKMSEAKLGKQKSEEHKLKMRKPKSAEHARKIGEAKRGTFWWNNGVITKRSKDCPGPEWQKGRL